MTGFNVRCSLFALRLVLVACCLVVSCLVCGSSYGQECAGGVCDFSGRGLVRREVAASRLFEFDGAGLFQRPLLRPLVRPFQLLRSRGCGDGMSDGGGEYGGDCGSARVGLFRGRRLLWWRQ